MTAHAKTTTMQAMRLHQQHEPLKFDTCPVPKPGDNEVLLKVSACAVCRTDLHVCDGDLTEPKLPLIPGHEIVGYVEACGKNVTGLKPGERVGVPWLGYTCGNCEFCKKGLENLCDQARFTGYQIDGGYAEYAVANQHFVFPLNNSMSDEHIAPLLCAGLIGYRSYRMTSDATRIGLYGFGAAAHIITQVALQQGKEIYAVTRRGDTYSQEFAKQLGVNWAGDTEESPPVQLDAAILYAPAGELVPLALRSVRKGGVVVCAGIHMSDIPSFPYDILWGERTVCSVANLTRKDGEEFLKLVEQLDINTEVTTFPMQEANMALDKLRAGELQGAAVLVNR